MWDFITKQYARYVAIKKACKEEKENYERLNAIQLELGMLGREVFGLKDPHKPASRKREDALTDWTNLDVVRSKVKKDWEEAKKRKEELMHPNRNTNKEDHIGGEVLVVSSSQEQVPHLPDALQLANQATRVQDKRDLKDFKHQTDITVAATEQGVRQQHARQLLTATTTYTIQTQTKLQASVIQSQIVTEKGLADLNRAKLERLNTERALQGLPPVGFEPSPPSPAVISPSPAPQPVPVAIPPMTPHYDEAFIEREAKKYAAIIRAADDRQSYHERLKQQYGELVVKEISLRAIELL